MLVIEIAIYRAWEFGFKRYTFMYGQVKVCVFDLGFVQLKLTRRAL